MSLIITNAGRNKIAAALAAGTPITVAEVRLGSANRFPTGGETALVSEVVRKPVIGTGTTADGQSYFDARLEADEGPFTIYEIGLFDVDGTLLFVGRIEGFHKAVLIDQPVTLDIRAYVLTSQFQNVVVQVETTFAFAPVSRRLTAGPGIGGGGDLSGDREFSLALGELPSVASGEVSLSWSVAGYRSADGATPEAHGRLGADALAALIGLAPEFRRDIWPGRYRAVSSARTLVKGDRVAADTSAGPFTLTLPASPAVGDWVVVSVTVGDAAAAPVTVVAAGGAFPVQDDLAGLVIDVPLATVPLVFTGSQWRLA